MHRAAARRVAGRRVAGGTADENAPTPRLADCRYSHTPLARSLSLCTAALWSAAVRNNPKRAAAPRQDRRCPLGASTHSWCRACNALQLGASRACVLLHASELCKMSHYAADGRNESTQSPNERDLRTVSGSSCVLARPGPYVRLPVSTELAFASACVACQNAWPCNGALPGLLSVTRRRRPVQSATCGSPREPGTRASWKSTASPERVPRSSRQLLR